MSTASDWAIFRNALRRYLKSVFPNMRPDDVDDVAQTTCYRAAKNGKGPDCHKWGQITARNAAVDFFRRQRHPVLEYDRLQALMDEECDARGGISQEPLQEYIAFSEDTTTVDVEMLLKMLPPHFEEAIQLRMMGYDCHDGARIMGGTAEAYKNRLYRAQLETRRLLHEQSQNQ